MARTILVSGSRGFPNSNLVRQTIQQMIASGDILMHGCAGGVDTWAGDAAHVCGATVLRRPADWDRYGKRAGYLRNEQMLQEARQHPNLLVLIFWDGTSRGTKHMIDLCTAARIPHQIIRPGQGVVHKIVEFRCVNSTQVL